MAKGSSVGYVFAIKDPHTGQYCYVSNSYNPQKAILHLLKYPYNKRMQEWAKQLKEDFPQGLQVLEVEPIAEFKGIDYEEEIRIPGVPLLEWLVLDIEDDTRAADKSIVFLSPTKKYFWIKKLEQEGYDLFNAQIGRPGDKNRIKLLVGQA